jgi:hypothetical protein
MKILVTALAFLALLLPAEAQYWANLPTHSLPLTNAVGVLVHNSAGYAKTTVLNISSNAASLSASNFTVTASIDAVSSGQLKTNTSNKPFLLIGSVTLTAGTGAGNAAMQIRVVGYTTNSAAMTITASGANPSVLFVSLPAFVPAGAEYTFTNSSTGTANTSTVTRVQMLQLNL